MVEIFVQLGGVLVSVVDYYNYTKKESFITDTVNGKGSIISKRISVFYGVTCA